MTITAISLFGIFRIFFKPFISAVLIEIVIITATNAAIGIDPIHDLNIKIINNKDKPEESVDNLVLPPFSEFITDWPTSAHPAIPPNIEATIFAIPCPLASLFLLELLSLASSKISCVKKVSINPTNEIASEVGRIIPKVFMLNGTLPFSNEPKGKEMEGKPSGNVPKSLTFGISSLRSKLMSVITIIAIN